MKAIDWFDIALHSSVGAVIGMVAGVTGWWILVLGNTLFWLIREIIQHGDFPHTPQSTLEWTIPTIVCSLIAAAWVLTNAR